MFDIDLKEKELEQLIIKLDTNNKTIVDAMENMYTTMIQIDDKDWHAPEKDRINNDFVPYIKEQEQIMNNGLLSNTKILKDALTAYRERNKELEEEYIDLIPILKSLYIQPEEFLKSIKSVEVQYA